MRLNWFGHVCRMDRDRLAKQALFDWQPPIITTRQGAPRTTWMSTVIRDLDVIDLDLVGARNKASDRKEWSEVVDMIVARCAPMRCLAK